MDHRFIRRSSAIAVALVLLLGACSSGDEGSTDDEGATATSATSAADTTSTAGAGAGGLDP